MSGSKGGKGGGMAQSIFGPRAGGAGGIFERLTQQFPEMMPQQMGGAGQFGGSNPILRQGGLGFGGPPFGQSPLPGAQPVLNQQPQGTQQFQGQQPILNQQVPGAQPFGGGQPISIGQPQGAQPFGGGQPISIGQPTGVQPFGGGQPISIGQPTGVMPFPQQQSPILKQQQAAAPQQSPLGALVGGRRVF